MGLSINDTHKVQIYDADGNIVSDFVGTSGGPATIADGADVTQGAVADAAVTSDDNGTLSAKLRGLVKWAYERMPTSLGQKTRAASLPVVLPSDATGANAVQLQGTAAAGAAPAGNPVNVGGVDAGSVQRSLLTATDGGLVVAGYDGVSATHRALSGYRSDADAQAAFTAGLSSRGQHLYNGTSWDRARCNMTLTVIASATRTAGTATGDFINYNHRGLILTMNISDAQGGQIKPRLRIKDVISGNYTYIWTATTYQTAVGTYIYLIYPEQLDLGTYVEVVKTVLARTWNCVISANNSSPMTYSVSADMLL